MWVPIIPILWYLVYVEYIVNILLVLWLLGKLFEVYKTQLSMCHGNVYFSNSTILFGQIVMMTNLYM